MESQDENEDEDETVKSRKSNDPLWGRRRRRRRSSRRRGVRFIGKK